jgi:cytochrome c biogenesis protein CcdA
VAAVVAGIALIVAAVALFVARRRLTRPRPPKETKRRSSGSALFFGAGLAFAELPTAFPYFAAIAAIQAEDLSPVQEFVLVVGFNVLFLLPVFLIAMLIEFFPSTWERVINPFRRWMSAHWPVVLAAVLAGGGVALLVYGV